MSAIRWQASTAGQQARRLGRFGAGRVARDDLAQERVCVERPPEGKGVPAQDIDRIFEKFYRSAKGDGRAAGTGLGLSISRGFVEAMGGSIKAESPAIRKRGTRFVIRLPAFSEPKDAEPR